MNIFPKYKFSHISASIFDTEEIFFGALEHAEKVYKWFFIVKFYTVLFVKFFRSPKKSKCVSNAWFWSLLDLQWGFGVSGDIIMMEVE